ncbi:hypothetical protein AB0F15_17845 [Amycolatopsis sp. NPDC026612]|uniref:hypothetical protein n=1 Tax=Amycolatopsis sp. NPDC026612 TaxID=3155466 RepID=UPI0033D26B78
MRLLVGFLAALLTTAGLAASAAPPESRPVYGYADGIRETAWVETAPTTTATAAAPTGRCSTRPCHASATR